MGEEVGRRRSIPTGEMGRRGKHHEHILNVGLSGFAILAMYGFRTALGKQTIFPSASLDE